MAAANVAEAQEVGSRKAITIGGWEVAGVSVAGQVSVLAAVLTKYFIVRCGRHVPC